jgi:hypothetical protein
VGRSIRQIRIRFPTFPILLLSIQEVLQLIHAIDEMN